MKMCMKRGEDPSLIVQGLEAHEDTLSEQKPSCSVKRGLAVNKNQCRLGAQKHV